MRDTKLFICISAFKFSPPLDLIACQGEVRNVLQPGQRRDIRNLIIGKPQAGKARQPGQRRKIANFAMRELRNRQIFSCQLMPRSLPPDYWKD